MEVEVGEVEDQLAGDVGDEEGDRDAPGKGDKRPSVGDDEPEAAAGLRDFGEVAEDGSGRNRDRTA